jgi:hypothetical protein
MFEAFKAPISIALVQYAHTSQLLLIVQETADTFGLLCLGVIFVGYQIFVRNSTFAVFHLYSTSSTSTTNSNSAKLFVQSVTALSHLRRSTSSTLERIRTWIMG